MDRKFLEDLGLEKEMVERIVIEHGKTVQPLQAKNDSLKVTAADLTEQLKQRDTDLVTLKDSSNGNEELQKQLNALKETYATEKTNSETKLKEMQMTTALKLELASKVHDVDLMSSLIDCSKITLDENGNIKEGLKEQVENLEKSKAFLFVTENNGKKFEGRNPIDGANTPSPKDNTESIGERLGKVKFEETKTAENPYFK